MNIEYTQEVTHGQLCTMIDVTEWTRDASGTVVGLRHVRTIYVHRSEYRHWEA